MLMSIFHWFYDVEGINVYSFIYFAIIVFRLQTDVGILVSILLQNTWFNVILTIFSLASRKE